MFAKHLAVCLAAALFLSPAVQAQEASAKSYEQAFSDRGSSYILVFAYPSAAYLDWSSPSKLARTAVQSTLAKRTFSLPSTIGHAQIAWSCRKPDGTLISRGASGQSGEDNGQSLVGLRSGWGMSILELVFTDGHLESPTDVDSRIRSGAAGNQFSWAGFKVPVENCLQMVDFVENYQKSEAYKNYGFPVDPLKFEGAGCTSYANAALERSGAPLPFRDAWVRRYPIPEAQLGRFGEPPAHAAVFPKSRIPKRDLQVPLTDFLFGEQTWARAGEASVPFQYYDPELFYESFLHLENAYRQTHQLPLKTAVRTSQLDDFQQKLKAETDAWIKRLGAQNTPMELGEIAGFTGLIVDLRNSQARL